MFQEGEGGRNRSVATRSKLKKVVIGDRTEDTRNIIMRGGRGMIAKRVLDGYGRLASVTVVWGGNIVEKCSEMMIKPVYDHEGVLKSAQGLSVGVKGQVSGEVSDDVVLTGRLKINGNRRQTEGNRGQPRQ